MEPTPRTEKVINVRPGFFEDLPQVRRIRLIVDSPGVHRNQRRREKDRSLRERREKSHEDAEADRQHGSGEGRPGNKWVRGRPNGHPKSGSNPRRRSDQFTRNSTDAAHRPTVSTGPRVTVTPSTTAALNCGCCHRQSHPDTPIDSNICGACRSGLRRHVRSHQTNLGQPSKNLPSPRIELVVCRACRAEQEDHVGWRQIEIFQPRNHEQYTKMNGIHPQNLARLYEPLSDADLSLPLPCADCAINQRLCEHTQPMNDMDATSGQQAYQDTDDLYRAQQAPSGGINAGIRNPTSQSAARTYQSLHISDPDSQGETTDELSTPFPHIRPTHRRPPGFTTAAGPSPTPGGPRLGYWIPNPTARLSPSAIADRNPSQPFPKQPLQHEGSSPLEDHTPPAPPHLSPGPGSLTPSPSPAPSRPPLSPAEVYFPSLPHDPQTASSRGTQTDAWISAALRRRRDYLRDRGELREEEDDDGEPRRRLTAMMPRLFAEAQEDWDAETGEEEGEGRPRNVWHQGRPNGHPDIRRYPSRPIHPPHTTRLYGFDFYRASARPFPSATSFDRAYCSPQSQHGATSYSSPPDPTSKINSEGSLHHRPRQRRPRSRSDPLPYNSSSSSLSCSFSSDTIDSPPSLISSITDPLPPPTRTRRHRLAKL